MDFDAVVVENSVLLTAENEETIQIELGYIQDILRVYRNKDVETEKLSDGVNPLYWSLSDSCYICSTDIENRTPSPMLDMVPRSEEQKTSGLRLSGTNTPLSICLDCLDGIGDTLIENRNIIAKTTADEL